MQYFANSDRGLTRPTNQDRFLTLPIGQEGCLLAVFDGMGGHAEGERAAELARDAFTEVFTARPPLTVAMGEECLLSAARLANDRILAYAGDGEGRQGMGTTVTALLLVGREVRVLNVGDSRTYLHRAGELFLLTRDDSYVRQLLEAGRLSEWELSHHPKRHIITRSLGSLDRKELTLEAGVCRKGDTFLLCSDGLWEMVNERIMQSILCQQLSPTATVAYLLASANERGGDDNITAIILRV